jgi:hypothetical protein
MIPAFDAPLLNLALSHSQMTKIDQRSEPNAVREGDITVFVSVASPVFYHNGRSRILSSFARNHRLEALPIRRIQHFKV